MCLVDTNVWLEHLLDQERAAEVGQFLDHVSSGQLLISDFTFHSIGIVLTRLGQAGTLMRFVQDAFIDGAVSLVRLEPVDMPRLVGAMSRFGLDFDDAYQYVLAEKYDLTVVTFDSDFGRTERGGLRHPS